MLKRAYIEITNMCNLRCSFCQNFSVSQEGIGKPLPVPELREVFQSLVRQGAACLDLVTPSHFTPAILAALGDEPWPVPVVWNSSGYEKTETLRLLQGRKLTLQYCIVFPHNNEEPQQQFIHPQLPESFSSIEDILDPQQKFQRILFKRNPVMDIQDRIREKDLSIGRKIMKLR